MLWRCLDRLPNGEPDLLGRGVTAALKDLNAQPDPAAAGDCGVQLMTIHKSKGLEFEVVILPDLHARCGNHRRAMLSWLERGLAEPDHSGEITEFLIAPFQPKGSDRGKTKEWVDREYRERERQETRRIFYVAATRAREELHLFARAEYKRDTGELCTPQESLLSAAWPAFEEELRSRLATWHSDREEAEVEELAAGAENVLPLSAAPKHAIVRRLPVDFRPPDPLRQQSAQPRISGPGPAALFARHEGGMASRALGTAVHAMMEELARLRTLGTWEAARAGLAKAVPRIASHAHSTGMDRKSAEQLALQALDIALRASRDPVAEWILSPQPGAASEVRWTGMVNGEIHTVQVDRVFRAGTAPSSEGTDAWWIIDYKSAHPDALNTAEVLSRLRPLFAPQLGIYAGVLRGLHGSESVIRAGLYYPRLLAFDWWEL
jgi:ATP-dependent exoDNAse (exonuclease V) beta subunit